jgi:hypothetical protein
LQAHPGAPVFVFQIYYQNPTSLTGAEKLLIKREQKRSG